ncbi:cytochrome-c peroxidase [Pseudogulbenkiania subflava]|uniref:Cytochrome c peroxidase n=1 Tax=Pseudogulbenkiania subflava DSM 22618 TaxID=1123014 RepID=A0A1Y6C0E4_9NEIS|nr:cytochrome c peroxidase [Pseudogulbenkiania subflava]SMF29936.1 cytochrome c peroxidase [Pseudogulbenkiania subflava DSM 22618]
MVKVCFVRRILWVRLVLVIPFCLAQETTLLGLPPVPAPSANPQTPAKIALGKTLFNDKRLSGDGSISCASCHQAEKAFADGRPLAKGIGGRIGSRNTPSLLNAAYLTSQFWDGRRASLEEQAKDPLVNPREHGLTDHDQVLRIIQANTRYPGDFRRAFGIRPSHLTIDHVAQALAAFVRTLVAGNSPFDRYLYAGQGEALSESARRGLALFRGRAQCATCHVVGPEYALFTDNGFHRLGVGFPKIEPRLADMVLGVARGRGQPVDQAIISDGEMAELGRFMVTFNPADIGRFKTPSLRNVANTAPYMHDGSVPTLFEAVEREIYYRGIETGRPLILTPQEKSDLVDFLKSLSSETLPPSS